MMTTCAAAWCLITIAWSVSPIAPGIFDQWELLRYVEPQGKELCEWNAKHSNVQAKPDFVSGLDLQVMEVRCVPGSER